MKNTFNLSHSNQTSMDGGVLAPIACVEVLPGDSMACRTRCLIRVAPLLTPVMHEVAVRLHAFYVPNRIVWDGWEGFITGKDDTTLPTITFDQAENALAEYMGATHVQGQELNALPFRAYNAVYNHYFRDQDLQPEAAEDNVELHRVAWQKDYFTTARAETAVGDTLDVPFSFDGSTLEVQGIYGQYNVNEGAVQDPDTGAQVSGASSSFSELRAARTGFSGIDPLVRPYIDATALETTGGIDVNDLRRTMDLQRLIDAKNRYGNRYVDYLRYMGVNPSDGRLDRPEYLGGGSTYITFSEVVSMAESGTLDLGALGGHGVGTLASRRFNKFFEEHGYMFVMMSIRPRAVYANATKRHFLYSRDVDYFHPELQLEEWQAISEREVYAPGNSSEVFGYVGKNDHYRHEQPYVSGAMKTAPYSDWHMAQIFNSAPALNNTFVTCAPTDRVFADTNEPEYIVSAAFDINARRNIRREAGR
jgi:hypothetical protein